MFKQNGDKREVKQNEGVFMFIKCYLESKLLEVI